MTFSLVARCRSTGMFGVAISSSSPAVAARCAYTRAGVGAVASQNITDPTLGPLMLDLMGGGMSADDAMAELARHARHLAYRQVLAVDSDGGTAIHSGPNALGLWAEAAGPDVAAGGNLLADETIPLVMVDAFSGATGHLGDRLLSALKAALEAGGEAGLVHSAGLQICGHVSWPIVDLRCDWTESCPITDLETAWIVYKPQIDAYVQRARNPEAAPSYGVPGDV